MTQQAPTPFLPETDRQIVRSPREAGSWEYYSELLDKLPDDLSIKGSATADALTAIPTVWARPLLFAEALFGGDRHPLNKEVVGEWRGLLAIFCFRDYYKFHVSEQQFDISERSRDRLARVLHTLRPDDHWQTIHLIYLDDMLVGGTSPKSLFFTAAEYKIASASSRDVDKYQPIVPWTNKETGRLFDAAEYFGSKNMEDELGVLRGWIKDAIDDLVRTSIPGDTEDERTKNELLRILREWKDDIPIADDVERVDFDQPVVNSEPYQYVSKMALIEEKIKSDFLLAATKGGGYSPIVIWEEGWKRNKDRAVFGAFRPTDVPIPKASQGNKLAGGKIEHPWLRPDLYFFTDKLLRLPLLSDKALLYHNQGYLPPLRREILEYFSPADLKGSLEWKEKEDGIEVTFRLPLKTGEGRKSPTSPAVVSRYYKKDQIMDFAAITGQNVPFLALWPDFKVVADIGTQAKPWLHYYCICENQGPVPLSIRPVNAQTPYETRERSLLWRLLEYPEAIECLWENEPIGLVLLGQPNPIKAGNGTWTVAVDFGTSNTSIFHSESEGSDPKPVVLKNRWVQITPGDAITLRYFLFTEFLPFLLEKDGDIQGIFPSHFKSFRTRAAAPEPFIDGIILFDEPAKWPYALAEKDIEQNLKWTTDANKRRLISTFLKQTLLMIGAEARNKGVDKIKIRWSYPSAFTNYMITDLQNVWESLVQTGQEVGIDISVELSETESVAVCKYMTIEEKAPTAATTRAQVIIDVGGGTSDIAIWLGGEMRSQSSLLIAGNVLSHYAEKNVAFSDALARIAGISQLAQLMRDRDRSSAALNLVLKRSGDAIRNALAAGENVKPEFKRARTVIFYAFSAVLYYVGLLFKQSKDQGYSIDGCDIYLSGNGAKLLKWVSSEGATDGALKAMLGSATTPLPLNGINIHRPNANKEEVARGLLYTAHFPHAEKRILQLAGESGYKLIPEETELSSNFNLYMESDVLDLKRLRVPNDFQELRKFLQAHDTEAEKLGLEKVGHLVDPDAIKARIEQRVSQMAEMKKKDMAFIQPFFIEEARLILDKLVGG